MDPQPTHTPLSLTELKYMSSQCNKQQLHTPLYFPVVFMVMTLFMWEPAA